MDPGEKIFSPSCRECGFRVFNRRYPKCESCGAALPESVVFSASERDALYAGEARERARKKEERKTDIDFQPDFGGDGDGGGGAG